MPNRELRQLKDGEFILEGDAYRVNAETPESQEDVGPGVFGMKAMKAAIFYRRKPYPDQCPEGLIWADQGFPDDKVPDEAHYFSSHKLRWFRTTDLPAQKKIAIPYHYAISTPRDMPASMAFLARVWPGRGRQLLPPGTLIPEGAEIGTIGEHWFVTWQHEPTLIGLTVAEGMLVRTGDTHGGVVRAKSINEVLSPKACKLIEMCPASEQVMGLILKETGKFIPDGMVDTASIKAWVLDNIIPAARFNQTLSDIPTESTASDRIVRTVPVRVAYNRKVQGLTVPGSVLATAAAGVLSGGGSVDVAATVALNSAREYIGVQALRLLEQHAAVDPVLEGPLPGYGEPMPGDARDGGRARAVIEIDQIKQWLDANLDNAGISER